MAEHLCGCGCGNLIFPDEEAYNEALSKAAQELADFADDDCMAAIMEENNGGTSDGNVRGK